LKKYEVVIEIESVETEDKVRLFIMRSLSQAIATNHYSRYREDTLRLKVSEIEGREAPRTRSLIPYTVCVFLGMLLLYGYQKTQGVF
jgi:hypothetical protein